MLLSVLAHARKAGVEQQNFQLRKSNRALLRTLRELTAGKETRVGSSIEQRVKELLGEEFGLDTDDIWNDDYIEEDLGGGLGSSLEKENEIWQVLEEEFNDGLMFDGKEDVMTVQDMIDVVEKSTGDESAVAVKVSEEASVGEQKVGQYGLPPDCSNIVFDSSCVGCRGEEQTCCTGVNCGPHQVCKMNYIFDWKCAPEGHTESGVGQDWDYDSDIEIVGLFPDGCSKIDVNKLAKLNRNDGGFESCKAGEVLVGPRVCCPLKVWEGWTFTPIEWHLDFDF